MSDLARVGAWCALLGAGLGAVVALRRRGLPRTYARDLLHVGAGVWALGLGGWRAPLAPTALVLAVAAATALVPLAAARVRPLAALRDAVSDGEERWSGIALYTLAFALATALGTRGHPAPAAAAIAALALGDGLGGAIGRRFGRHHFAAPGGKRKSLEGSLAVAALAGLGAVAAARCYGASITPSLLAAGPVAAVAEAIAPRGTDNLIVPVAVYLVLTL